MADLFLHLAFARRLRTADGLHPIAAEALARRAPLVCFGAALADLPHNERKSLSFFRKLFSRGGEAARWQKLLVGAPPRADLIAALLVVPSEKGEAVPGSMMRTALALGVLAHDVLEEALGASPALLLAPERAGIERAQARLWLQTAVPNAPDLEREWRPVAELGDTEVFRGAIGHVDRTLQQMHGASPGEATLARWLKRLAQDTQPLCEVPKSGGVPPSLGLDDGTARGPHFEQAGVLEKTQGAVTRFVLIADRLGEALAGDPSKDALVALVNDAWKAPFDASTAATELSEARPRWLTWLRALRDAALTRGRNPKPAWEGDSNGELRVPSAAAVTKVMTLADLPPEAAGSGAPPIPDQSGPLIRPPPTPNVTQEVSVAQIEAEAASGGFVAPAHTQEVSVAQIEGAIAGATSDFPAPAHTQEVSVAQIEDEEKNAPARGPSTTQPITAEDILLARGEAVAAPTPTVTDPGIAGPSSNGASHSTVGTTEPTVAPSTEAPAEGAPTPAHTAPATETPKRE